MGITKQSTGKAAMSDLFLKENSKGNKVVAIAGNPNVGKSTVFNSLTGLKQHTGNWPGKTVSNAQGEYKYNNEIFRLVDIPGTYSLMANSMEEEIARDFICFGGSDAVIVVVDATCIERSLNLVIQILEITRNVILCVNLMDEAKKKKILIDLDEISINLGVPVVGTNAREGEGLDDLMDEVYNVAYGYKKTFNVKIDYGDLIEEAISKIKEKAFKLVGDSIDSRWLSLRLLDSDNKLTETIKSYLGYDILENQDIFETVESERKRIYEYTKDKEYIRDKIVSQIVHRSENIYGLSVKVEDKKYNHRDRAVDKILTSKITGIPVMIFMLMGIFWLTITGANYPSEVIASFLFWVQEKLSDFFVYMNAPEWVNGILVMGVYRTLAWVVSVMLPPMAIFFPMFTLLEDIGYLPRIAFNIDKFFKNAGAHGKQALTMCMGFGCNACGIIGCRIIDSPRERLIAILTNNFVPCNGRFAPLM